MTLLLLLLALAPCAPPVEPLDLLVRAAKLTGATCPVKLPARKKPREPDEWEI